MKVIWVQWVVMVRPHDPNATQGNQNSRPTHTVRKKVRHGKRADFEMLVVAWDRGDGSLYIKPYGAQIIEGGFYVFPVTDQEDGQ